MSWTAHYMPALGYNEEDPTRHGFATKEEALQYVFDGMCDDCNKQLEDHRNNVPEHHPYSDTGWKEGDKEVWTSGYPACACEWFVVKTEDWEQCNDPVDILKAAGYTKVYDKTNDD